MKNDKRLDEAFRKGLPSVEVPPPPAQDWAALARAAKQGARAAAVRDSGSLLNVRWLRLLGGASAILAAWYLASGPQAAQNTPTQAAHSTDAPAAHAEFMGGAPADLADLVTERTVDEPPATDLNTAAMGTADPLDGAAAARKDGRSQEETEARRADAEESGLPSETSRQAWASVGHRNRASEAKMKAMVARDEGARTPEDAPPSADAHMSTGAATAGRGTGTTALITSKDEREDIIAIRMLPTLSSPLPYTPIDPPAKPATDSPSLAHWSIAPWFSLGHTTWEDPKNGDNGSLQQLSVGHEQPGSIGLRVQYAVDHRLAMIIGIQYARKGGLRGTVRPSPFITTDYELSGNYWEVPISLKFTLPLENKELYVRTGGVLQFNVNSGIDKVAMNDASRKELSTLVLAGGSMGTALEIGIGAQFRLGHRLGLFIEPSYQHALSPVAKHPSFDKLPFNPHIHSFNLATGLSFQFH